MRKDTIQRKNARNGFRAVTGEDWMRDRLFQVIANGKQALDNTMMDIGRMMAE